MKFKSKNTQKIHYFSNSTKQGFPSMTMPTATPITNSEPTALSQELTNLQKQIERDYPAISLWISLSRGSLVVSEIQIKDKTNRGKGYGTKAMGRIVDFADKHGLSIYLTPVSDFGGSVSRLKKFYKGFGFVPYHGYEYRETYVRHPVVKIDDGEVDKIIACENCDWTWSESETEPHDKYVCHKCWHDNTPVEKLEAGGKVESSSIIIEKLIAKLKKEKYSGFSLPNRESVNPEYKSRYDYLLNEQTGLEDFIGIVSDLYDNGGYIYRSIFLKEGEQPNLNKVGHHYTVTEENLYNIDFSQSQNWLDDNEDYDGKVYACHIKVYTKIVEVKSVDRYEIGRQSNEINPKTKTKILEAGGAIDDYSKWKRANVTYRGVRELGLPNSGASGVLGRGLYSAPSSNKAMAKEYGGIYFIVNARPKNPKVFNTMNHWEIWCQRVLYTKYSKDEFPDLREFNKHSTIEKEMLALGYDGIEIKGREMVNYTPPENVKYFKSEADLKIYYEAIPKLGEGGLVGNIYTDIEYVVNIGGEDWADTECVRGSLEDAKSEYDSISSSDFGSKANSRSNYKELLKLEKRYKFVGDIGEDESIDDYIDNDFLKDDKYWELIEEKDSEQLEVDSVERVNEKADELLYEVQNHFDTYGGYKTIYLDEDETISLKLRIKNHSGKHRNKGLEEYFLSIVISDQDPTKHFKTQGPEGISSEEEFEFSSESNKDEIIEFINDKIKEFQ